MEKGCCHRGKDLVLSPLVVSLFITGENENFFNISGTEETCLLKLYIA
jgi:hypothetical protein